jgi:phage/plasmid-like protein (TIGR03299 family)
MSHEFTEGKGFFVHEPSWHKLERAVLETWPGSWAEARDKAGLDWEPVIVPAYTGHVATDVIGYRPEPEWNGIIRSDTKALLGFQPTTYKVINNSEYGKFLEIIMGTEKVQIEALFELYGGRQVCALLRFPEVRRVAGDPSDYRTYLAAKTRHDGNGGLKVDATNIRFQCANTGRMIDSTTKEGKDSWTVRHTENWGERLEEVAAELQSLFEGQQPYYELGSALNARGLTGNDLEDRSRLVPNQLIRHSAQDLIQRYLPIGDDMTDKQRANRLEERQVVMDVYYSESCEGIRGTYWGVYNAFTEWVDHGRKYRTVQSYVDRTLSPSPIKRRALKITRRLAGV